MDDPPTALALVWAQCLTAAAIHGTRHDWEESDIQALADQWFNQALILGEAQAEEQDAQRQERATLTPEPDDSPLPF